jgi:hypothetical protein
MSRNVVWQTDTSVMEEFLLDFHGINFLDNFLPLYKTTYRPISKQYNVEAGFIFGFYAGNKLLN